MTVKNAILLAKKTLKEDVEYLQHIKKISAKDLPRDKILTKISDLVSTIVFNEIFLCALIICELESQK